MVRPATARVVAAVGVLLAGCAGAGSGSPTSDTTIRGESIEPATASARPQATATSSLQASEDPAASAEPLVLDGWAEVIVDAVNLRAAPGTSAGSLGRLPRGSAGFVAGGPVTADGYTWYALAAPGVPYGSGCSSPPEPHLLTCPVWSGWVASADTDGEPWLSATDLGCSRTPTTVEDAAYIQAGVRLACFGGQDLTLRAYVGPLIGPRECILPYRVTPEWLHPCSVAFLHGTETEPDGQGPELATYLHPTAGQCNFGGRSPDTCPYAPFIGQWIEVDGHFDDPAAATCEVHTELGAPGIHPVLAIYGCRERFVVTAIRADD